VQLSFQEAFFLAHVLNCCSVYAGRYDAIPEQQQQQQEEQIVVQQPQQLQAQQQQQHVQQPLSPAELWGWCCCNAPGGVLSFVSRYAAYKHFRCKGWLPLPGLLYGANYVLYKLHPEWAHSDFLVQIMLERPAAAAAAAAADGAEGPYSEQQDGIETEKALQKEQQPSGLQSDVLGNADVGSTAGEAGGGSTQLTWLDAHIMQRLARQVLKQLLMLYVVIPSGLDVGSYECMQQIEVREVLLQRWVPSEHREDGKA
jgi:hypothetical protein